MGHQKSMNNSCLTRRRSHGDKKEKEWFQHIQQRVQLSDPGSGKSDGEKEKEWFQHIHHHVQQSDHGSNPGRDLESGKSDLGSDLGSGKSDGENEKEEGLSVQLLSGFVISLVALLQGAGVASSSVLHSLQQEPFYSSHLP